jgi:PAS domain S-box-containing protein
MDRIMDIPTVKIVIVELDGAYDSTVRHLRIKYINAAAAAFLGYREQELLGKCFDRICPDTHNGQSWQSAIAQLTGTAASLSFAGEIINKEKNGIPVIVSLAVLPGLNPDLESILVLLQEPGGPVQQKANPSFDKDSDGGVIQCKEVESALIESEERFRQMADMAGEWLWEQDPGGYYIYSSTAVNQILGFTQNEVIGRHYTEFLTVQDKKDQQSYAAIQHPFYGLTNHYQHKDGHQVITESTGLPIIDAAGKLLKWRGVDRDITARKQFQDALIESEKHIRLIIESSLSGIIIMDSYGIITDWNHQAEKIFGWSRVEAIGQRLDQLIIPERLRHAHRQGLQHFLRTGAGPILNRLIEQVAIRRDQTEFPVELSISPMKVGNAYSFSAFIHDISSRKAAEREIRQGQVKLAIARNEIDIARKIQASLSPSAPIETEHFEVTGFCLPADQVGGDYFDYFYRDNHRLEMIIADVSGHSIGPALFMVETRSAIRAQAKGQETPAEKMNLLNQFLFEDLDKSDFFITLFYLQYDTRNRQLCFANAGHPPPLLFQPAQNACIKLDAEGLILGVDRNVRFEEKTTTLSKGDIILLYTDGLIEAENDLGEFFGIDRVSDIFKEHSGQSPKQIIDALLEQLKQFYWAGNFNDDITLMVFKCG